MKPTGLVSTARRFLPATMRRARSYLAQSDTIAYWRNLERALLGRPDTIAYWEYRARTFGRRAVLNLHHDEMAFETVTDDQWAMYSAILEKAMQSRRRKILDFGCGPGRFTSLLTGYANEVIGVDVCKALLHLAPTSERVKYIQILPSCLPFSAGHFDMVWINLVLGGIVDDLSLRSTAAEIERVLSPGGLLFLAENTTRGDAQPYWKFRSRSEYTRLFPSSQLEIATTYTDVNEEITVLVGHKLT